MLIAMPLWISTPVNAAPVNCEPWSVLKISGLPWRAKASSSVSTQNAASIVIDTRHDSTRRLKPVEHNGQINEATSHRNIRDVHRPHLIRLRDLHSAQQIRIDLVSRLRRRRARTAIERLYPHSLH